MSHRRCSTGSAAMAAALMCSAWASGRSVVYVKEAAGPGGDGLSWSSALNSLQSAIALAQASGGAFNEIWVSAGIYKPDGGSADRSLSFTLFSGLTIRGGFAGTELSAAERAPTGNTTILSGDIGVTGDSTDNSFHVVQLRIFFAPATLERLTISGGRADGSSWPSNSGGGMLNEGSPTILGCTFQNNHAVSGAGLYSRIGAPTIDSCVFKTGAASSEGGGAFVRDGGTIIGSVFSGNNAGFGGGLSICCGAVRVRGCSFASNFANYGGGLYSPLGPVIVSGSSFTSNSASKGAGIFTAGTGVTVTSCFFGGNSGEKGGGGHHTGASTVIAGCAYSRNFATLNGGGLYTTSPSLSAVNCTLIANDALLFGGGVYCELGGCALSNTILWGNTDSNGSLEGAQLTRASGSLVPRFNCMQGWTGALGGQGNLSAAPLLADPDGPDDVPGTIDDNLRPVPGSPCIDRGESAALPTDAADLDGDSIITEPLPLDLGGALRMAEDPATPDLGLGAPPMVDVGAYEFHPAPPPGLVGDADLDGDVDFADVTMVLAGFGQSGGSADVDGSGTVDFGDITVVLANYGATLPPP